MIAESFRFIALAACAITPWWISQTVAAEQESSDASPTAEIVDARRIWDAAPHNAFTDLLWRDDRLWCVFREGQAHVSPDGAIRVIVSPDGIAWESAALIRSTTEDLRDAKLTVAPDGRFMLIGAGAIRQGASTTHQSYVWFSEDGREWTHATPVGDADYWLWRVTWHKGNCYGIGYHCGEPENVRLYRSADGLRFETLVENLYDQGSPNETSIVFLPDDTALCLLRRNAANGLLGTAAPPYREWQWRDIGMLIGGPHMLLLPDGRLVAAVRLYEPQARTSLCWVDASSGRIAEFLALPSGGDTSYAGLVWHNDLLWVSYYSSHEDKTAIYLARVSIDKPPAATQPTEKGETP